MKEFQKKIDVEGMFSIDAKLSFSDTEWKVEYFFAPVNKDVEIGGTIEDGQLKITHDNCGFGPNILPTLQKEYEALV